MMCYAYSKRKIKREYEKKKKNHRKISYAKHLFLQKMLLFPLVPDAPNRQIKIYQLLCTFHAFYCKNSNETHNRLFA